MNTADVWPRPPFGRPSVDTAEVMIATSQPLATAAGVRAFERGGNAADAALAAAAVLCVTEPMSTGVGGDAFAAVWWDGELVGLDAAGPAPATADPDEPVAERGPRSVTVPGAVAGWQALSERFGRLGLDTCLAEAIDLAERGYAVSPIAAAAWDAAAAPSANWAESVVPPELEPAPRPGEVVRLPELGATLRRLAEDGAAALYRGALAESICSSSWLEEEDLIGYEAAWTEPLRVRYRDYEVAELPPPTQGVAALEALALLEGLEPTLFNQVRCTQLALEDAFARVRDGADVSDLLLPDAIARRRGMVPPSSAEPGGGTVYLCAVDADGNAVSFIQSLYGYFGSGIVAPGTGIVLQNRAACFSVSGRVEPGRRPYHTIIPGMLLRDGELAGPFGVMGGFIQAQAHLQFVSALVDRGLDPQAALDEPRFRVAGAEILLERGLWDRAPELERHGFDVVCEGATVGFGGGQAILRTETGLRRWIRRQEGRSRGGLLSARATARRRSPISTQVSPPRLRRRRGPCEVDGERTGNLTEARRRQGHVTESRPEPQAGPLSAAPPGEERWAARPTRYGPAGLGRVTRLGDPGPKPSRGDDRSDRAGCGAPIAPVVCGRGGKRTEAVAQDVTRRPRYGKSQTSARSSASLSLQRAVSA